MKTFIIAEAGINHNGNIGIAKKLINEAKKSGADAIKFQTYITEDLVIENTKKVKYQKIHDNNKSMSQMLKKTELTFNQFKILKKYCEKKNIIFMSSAFDEKSLRFLASLKLRYYKIPSGEINNYPDLKIISKLNKKVLLSTGMSTINEIDKTLFLLKKFGLKKKNTIVMHCNSSYPTSINDANLKIIKTLKKRYQLEVGYSDHTEGVIAPLIAVTLGAKYIEKHFTLSKLLKGPDHFFSLTPSEFTLMVKDIRQVEKLLGKSNKILTQSEMENRTLSRKSIVAKKKIIKGSKFNHLNLTTKRPGNGISPYNWSKIIGKLAKKNYKINDQI